MLSLEYTKERSCMINAYVSPSPAPILQISSE